MNLRVVDLNLFVAFEALMAEHSVTGAARRISVSQPALSEALARLRLMFGDELFVRTPGGMAPTAKALEASAPIAEALAGLRGVLAANAPFDPATARKTFRVGAGDYTEIIILPALNSRLRVAAPGIDLRMIPVDPKRAMALIDSGEADFAIDVFGRALPKRFERIALLRERAICLSRQGHPALKVDGLTLEHYVGLPHVVRSITGVVNRALVDRALAQAGLKRRVALSISNFLALPSVIQETELIATQPERVARRLAAIGGLDVHESPIRLPGWTVDLIWGRGGTKDQASAWMRSLIREVCAGL